MSISEEEASRRLHSPHLLPLPQAPYVMVIWREHKVHPDTHILFERSLYSVPWKLIGKKVLARGTASSVTIYRTSAHQMLTQLRASRADDSHERRMSRFTSPDLLIIDDLGLRPLAHDEPMDLYEVIRHRYERGSMIITSNRAIEEWPPLFLDQLLAGAAMDRLLHHCHVIVLDGDSYRNPPSKRVKKARVA